MQSQFRGQKKQAFKVFQMRHVMEARERGKRGRIGKPRDKEGEDRGEGE